MLEKALNLIADKVEKVLCARGFKRSTVDMNTVVFTGKSESYTVNFSNNKMVLSKCVGCIDEENPAKEISQIICEWFFDPNTSNLDDAKSIASDFADVFSKSSKKNCKSASFETENSKAESDGLHFFLNRLLTLFPELKPKLALEKSEYSKIRYVTFIEENFVPLFLEVLSNCKVNKDKVRKIVNVLNNFYMNGNMDVRSTITMVILNSINDSKCLETVNNFLDNNLKEAAVAAKEYKFKKVKPEKLRKTFLSKMLAANKTFS